MSLVQEQTFTKRNQSWIGTDSSTNLDFERIELANSSAAS